MNGDDGCRNYVSVPNPIKLCILKWLRSQFYVIHILPQLNIFKDAQRAECGFHVFNLIWMSFTLFEQLEPCCLHRHWLTNCSVWPGLQAGLGVPPSKPLLRHWYDGGGVGVMVIVMVVPTGKIQMVFTSTLHKWEDWCPRISQNAPRAKISN